MRLPARRTACLILVLLSAHVAAAGDAWPQFRGPTGDGHSDATNLPLTWSETENVVWKTPIHDRGWSSPVIWQDQVWMTTATADGHAMFAVCVDRNTGKIVHDIKVFDTPEPEHIAAVASYASPTPVVAAGRVYVHFGTYGTACLDTASGSVVWSRRDLKCDHHEGAGSSPILFGDLLIFHVDGRDVQYVIALDKNTGNTVWKTDRSIDFGPFDRNIRKAFCTPIIIEAGSGLQLISPGAKGLMAYNPLTGQELWKIRYNGWSLTPRPLFGHGLVYFINDYEKPELVAVRPDGQGEIGDGNVAWKISKGMPSRPSPLLVGDLLFIVNSDGVGSCVDAKTGETIWKSRISGNFSASPIFADGHIYVCDEGSVTTVLEPTREYKLIAVNKLTDEEMFASPAVVGSALYLRSAHHLYRIEKKN